MLSILRNRTFIKKLHTMDKESMDKFNRLVLSAPKLLEELKEHICSLALETSKYPSESAMQLIEYIDGEPFDIDKHI